MKVLVAGDWHSGLHEAEVCRSLRRLGHEALEFKWFHYFAFDTNKQQHSLGTLIKRLQNKFVVGSLIRCINRDFVAQVRRPRPNAVFYLRGHIADSRTLLFPLICMPSIF